MSAAGSATVQRGGGTESVEQKGVSQRKESSHRSRPRRVRTQTEGNIGNGLEGQAGEDVAWAV